MRLFKGRCYSAKKHGVACWGRGGGVLYETDGSEGRVTKWETNPSAVKRKVELQRRRTNKKKFQNAL